MNRNGVISDSLERGCVAEQPQQLEFVHGVKKSSGVGLRTFLRLALLPLHSRAPDKIRRGAKLLLCVALGLVGCSFKHSNTIHSSNEVVGARLTGHASWNGQSWPFEIVMEGYSRYYHKETYPKPTNNFDQAKMSPAFGIWAAIDDVGDSRDRGYVARRFWRGDTFCGVAPDELRDLVEYGHYVEEFTSPVSFDHFPIPSVVKWTDSDSADHRVITYTIESVTYTNQHDPKFWKELRREHFAYAEQHPGTSSTWHEPLSPARLIATNALQEAQKNPAGAVATLRPALAQFPLDQPTGAREQSALLGALWQIRGLQVKDELVDWLYQSLPRARNPVNSSHGVLDHGPLCLLLAVGSSKESDTAQLLRAIVADPRFEQLDAVTIVLMMEICHESFPVPDGVALRQVDIDDNNKIPKQLLPLWRNMLRRHYGLPEVKL